MFYFVWLYPKNRNKDFSGKEVLGSRGDWKLHWFREIRCAIRIFKAACEATWHFTIQSISIPSRFLLPVYLQLPHLPYSATTMQYGECNNWRLTLRALCGIKHDTKIDQSEVEEAPTAPIVTSKLLLCTQVIFNLSSPCVQCFQQRRSAWLNFHCSPLYFLEKRSPCYVGGIFVGAMWKAQMGVNSIHQCFVTGHQVPRPTTERSKFRDPISLV